MRKYLGIVAASILFSQILSPAHASLNAPINLENPRVVPIFGQPIGMVAPAAGWSGYLYSPRIIFSAAHSNYKFDNNGNRILSEPALITVGRPNSAASVQTGRVKVIKTFVGNFRAGKSAGALDDFIVYVLEKDLAAIQPANLLTPDISKVLVATKAEVSFHGYGEYRDRCGPGQVNPCKKDFQNPNHTTSELPRVSKLNLAAGSDASLLDAQLIEDLKNEILVLNPAGCPGDSGGPITTVYKGAPIYLGQGLDGGNFYACGASPASKNDPRAFGYFSPVYKHLDLIKAAEDYIKANPATTSKSTITCIKGKLEKKVTGTNPKCPAGFKKK